MMKSEDGGALVNYSAVFEEATVVRGSSPLTAENLMIAVDQTIVKDGVTNCVDALVMMFVYYYCLNISYPLELGATLEFMQRCLFRINPDRGTKVEKQQSKKTAVHKS
ncbi:hypothetical protein G5714_002354 [Onychostoma macrolepis]|uniref:Uncharacterized protein n=1 Tax=Onychostoma macrolepis TaxID=369639 RepID=A0A7J6DFE0_9TELE|nr:hypothetical protein G5714_002354 [Onychostoma macrolepis]